MNPEENTPEQAQQYSPDAATAALLAQRVGQLTHELVREQAQHTGTQIELQNASLALQQAARELEDAAQRIRELEGEDVAADEAGAAPEQAVEGAAAAVEG